MTDIQESTTLADTNAVEPAAAAAAASTLDAAAASAAAGPSSEGNGIKPPTDGDEVDAKIDKVRLPRRPKHLRKRLAITASTALPPVLCDARPASPPVRLCATTRLL